MEMIELQGVSKTLRGRQVLEDISLSLDVGGVLGLAGVNGSGKTMILRLIAGLIRPSRGRVLVNGREATVRGKFPEDIGVLIETPSFLPCYSGTQNLNLLASLRRVADEEVVAWWLAEVGLDPADARPFRKYSLGMKQRLGLAAALMESPRIVLLDEPTNALDPEGVSMVKRQIVAARERGAAVVVACHDASVLDAVADRVLYLAEGRVVGDVVLREAR